MARLKLKFAGLKDETLYKRKVNSEGTFKILDGDLFCVSGGEKEKVTFEDWDLRKLLESEFIEIKPKLTDTQRKILEGRLAEGFEWIAEDEDGKLFVYDDKPTKGDTWWCGRKECNQIYIKLYSLSWEDGEPTNIRELFRGGIKNANSLYSRSDHE